METIKQFYNADCIKFMENWGGYADLTLTDIPYGELNNNKENGLRKVTKGKADESTFNLNTFLDLVYEKTKGTIIIFCGQGQLSQILKYFWDKQDFEGAKIAIRQLIWKKTNPSPMNGENQYLSGIENAVWIKKRGATFNAFCKINVLEFPTGSSEIHPTEKNHALLADLIKDNSNENDIVFDPCAGSGSTLLVAHKLNRQFIGCELDKGFYQIAKKRLDAELAQMTIFDFIERSEA